MAAKKTFTAKEPVYAGEEVGTLEYKRKLVDVLNYNNYAHTTKDLMKRVPQYASTIKTISPELLVEWKKLGEKYTGMTVCSVAKFALQGAPLSEKHTAWFEDKLRQAIALGRKTEKPEEDTTGKPKAPVLTIQDRLAIQLNSFLTDIAHIEDKVIDGEKYTKGEIASYLQSKEVPQASSPKISEYYTRQLKELQEVKAKTCEQLNEGYAHIKPAEITRLIAFYSDLIEECDHYTASKKAQRKTTRKVKPRSKDKIVAKLKYLKQHDDLKLVSINPTKIVDSTTLWVYNTKTRKLGCYKADDMTGPLTVKGMSIVGYDESTSIQKTLRKPKEQLAEIKKMSKVKLRKALANIKAIEIKLTGRLNADTIILNAY